jgi:hypothetical protein
MFIIVTAKKQFQLTAGKIVPVSNVTMIHVRTGVKLPVTNYTENRVLGYQAKSLV